ncbi:MAG: hypothetical protein M5T52_15270 [Ignavibacteriaceae bacterium]|nr:hypothetical protein [Ignavibacteriaceae bacterium]
MRQKYLLKRIKEFSLDKVEFINTQLISNFPSVVVDIPVANYLWDLIYLNGEEIQNDFKIYTKENPQQRKSIPE